MTALFSIIFPALLLLMAPVCVAAQAPGGELVLRSFQNCFPEKISGLALRDGDWSIQMNGEIFYWAGGRLLPEGERRSAAAYSPHVFEIYPTTVPSPEIYSEQYIEALRRRGGDEALRERDNQHWGFYTALYGGPARADIESRLDRVQFLGRKITVHRDITGALRRVDRAIRRADSAFLGSIGSIGGYNWREIRGTGRMSYHSWGLAVDIQPARLGNKSIYWLWERGRSENWMLIPLEDRWKPPDAVIAAFEGEGFIWGGKWPLYDAMHFEWRPELHELKRLLQLDG